ncbi:MAG TPA: cell wall-binding repeat-containing protein, partial [Euzebya sp.]|nr:cell wall-binding repeat-containing protein [Euzebya sp.]
ALASGALQATRSPEGETTGGRPLLLTPTDQLDVSVVAELERLGATSVRILGGVAAIGQGVEDELRGRGLAVERYAGPSRLETATDIAQRGFPSATTAILARAFPAEGAGDPTQAFADSLAAGAWAASRGWPLLLTQTEVLSGSTRTYLESSGITTVRVVGGTAAISDSVLDELRAMGLTVDRIAGPSRFDTALAITAQRGYTTEVDAPRVMVIDGQGPEAWAAGFAAAGYSAINDAPVLLGTADVVPGPTANWLDPTGSEGDPGFAVDEANITGPVLVCAIAGPRCDESRSLLGLPDLAQLALDQNGMTVDQGSTLGGMLTNTTEGATLQPVAGCLDEIDPLDVPSGPEPVSLTLQLPEDGRLGPCDISFVVAFPNGSVQTIVQSINVADPT